MKDFLGNMYMSSLTEKTTWQSIKCPTSCHENDKMAIQWYEIWVYENDEYESACLSVCKSWVWGC